MTGFPEVGTSFLGFRLESELGRGAFGRVYLARQGDFANRLVALKISAEILSETGADPLFWRDRRASGQGRCATLRRQFGTARERAGRIGCWVRDWTANCRGDQALKGLAPRLRS